MFGIQIRQLAKPGLLPLVLLTCNQGADAQQQDPRYEQAGSSGRLPSVVGQSAQQPLNQRMLVQPIVRQKQSESLVGAPSGQVIGSNGANGQLGQPLQQVPGQPNHELPGQPIAQPGGPPFPIDPVEQQFVEQILQMWETESSKVKTFTSDFQRLEYDAVFGPGAETPIIISTGRVSYAKPDQGSFKIESIKRWAPNDANNPEGGKHVLQKNEVGEHWVCDGKAVYEYDHRNKQLVVTPIPPEMRGKSIVDGPLPFLFGAEAKKIQQRYWIKVAQSNPNQIQLEAYPRRASDAQNYRQVDVMLDRKSMQPTALQVHLPGGQQRHVYMFEDPTINGKLDGLFGNLFNKPVVPIGWKRVIQDGAGPQAANPNAGPIQR